MCPQCESCSHKSTECVRPVVFFFFFRNDRFAMRYRKDSKRDQSPGFQSLMALLGSVSEALQRPDVRGPPQHASPAHPVPPELAMIA